VTFMSAGTETTAYCLAYTILLLARHAEVITEAPPGRRLI
jgi:cytochrome P450